MNIMVRRPGIIILNSSISAHRICELVELPKEVHIPESPEMDVFAEQGFEERMKEVDFAYIEGKNVITDPDFVACPGEIVALVGPSGERKITMIRLILGLVHPEEATEEAIVEALKIACAWDFVEKLPYDFQIS